MERQQGDGLGAGSGMEGNSRPDADGVDADERRHGFAAGAATWILAGTPSSFTLLRQPGKDGLAAQLIQRPLLVALQPVPSPAPMIRLTERRGPGRHKVSSSTPYERALMLSRTARPSLVVVPEPEPAG